MTLERVRLTDFTIEELKAVYVALELAGVLTESLTPEQREAVELFKTQLINACSQRTLEERTLMN